MWVFDTVGGKWYQAPVCNPYFFPSGTSYHPPQQPTKQPTTKPLIGVADYTLPVSNVRLTQQPTQQRTTKLPIGVADYTLPASNVRWLPNADVPKIEIKLGILDNKAQYDFWMTPSSLTHNFLTRNFLTRNFVLAGTNIDPFLHAPIDPVTKDAISAFTNPLCFPAAYLLACARVSKANELDMTRKDNKQDITTRLVTCCGELMAREVLPELCLPQAEAGQQLVSLVFHLCHMTQITALTTITSVAWVKERTTAPVYVDPNADPKIIKTLGGRFFDNKDILPADWPWINAPHLADRDDGSVDTSKITPTLAMSILVWLAEHIHSSLEMIPLVLIVSTHVALAKRGACTDGFLYKICDGVMSDLNKTISLSPHVIKAIFHAYGTYINQHNTKSLFLRWENMIPPTALRLRLTMQQMRGEGLTTINVIVKAMRLYSDFDWARIAHVFPDEIIAATRALRVIDNNPYHGYAPDVRFVRSTLYKNVSYVAKELLIKINGEGALSQYRGWPHAPKYQAVLDRMVLDYMNHKTKSMTSDSTDEDKIKADDLMHVANEILNLE